MAESEFWYILISIVAMVYLISVLMIRLGINQRRHERRIKERRVCTQHVPIERRKNVFDRRQVERRAA